MDLHVQLVHEEKKADLLNAVSTSEKKSFSNNQFCNPNNALVESNDSQLNQENKSAQVHEKKKSVGRPKMSYAKLIAEALNNSLNGMLVLSDIYQAISARHAYYRMEIRGWQNSIRHNLSINKSFEKSDKKGKGEKHGFYGKQINIPSVHEKQETKRNHGF